MAEITGTAGDDVLNGGNSNDRLNGLAGNDLLNGRGGDDVLIGGTGNDTYVVDSPGDRIVELEDEGIDTVYSDINFWLAADDYVELLSARDWRSTTPLQLFGNWMVNVLDGNDGNNFLDGGVGGDTMIGFAGDDTYVVDSTFDRAVEDPGGGFDTIYTEVSYSLTDGDNIELLSVRDWRSVTPLSLTGNSAANTIDGNDGNNFLDGAGGADVLVGMGGDDVYVVDNAGDQVVEANGLDVDLVYTSVDYSLATAAFVENLIARDVLSTTPLHLTGNARSNMIGGNEGANVIDGGGGSDLLVGQGGDDLYYISAGDRVVELDGGGIDTVLTTSSYTLEGGVENASGRDPDAFVALSLVGNSLDNRLTANAQGNILWGNDGNDYLDGQRNSDRLIGGAGSDTFAFTTALLNNRDTIDDFQPGVDKLALDNAIFTGLPDGALSASAFVVGSAAQDADDRIIYNNGRLYFDADGTGAIAAVEFAGLVGTPAITAADFVVI